MNGFETILPFLKPIEHLLLDASISEVMVNGADHIFIEKDGFVEPVPDIHLGEKFLMVAVKNIARRLGDDISESKPILDTRLPSGSRESRIGFDSEMSSSSRRAMFLTATIRDFSPR